MVSLKLTSRWCELNVCVCVCVWVCTRFAWGGFAFIFLILQGHLAAPPQRSPSKPTRIETLSATEMEIVIKARAVTHFRISFILVISLSISVRPTAWALRLSIADYLQWNFRFWVSSQTEPLEFLSHFEFKYTTTRELKLEKPEIFLNRQTPIWNDSPSRFSSAVRNWTDVPSDLNTALMFSSIF